MIGIPVRRWPRALSRTVAMFIKEFLQLRRDRLTFGTMIFIPIIQLSLFGFAINTTPRHLPTAVLAYENLEVTARALIRSSLPPRVSLREPGLREDLEAEAIARPM